MKPAAPFALLASLGIATPAPAQQLERPSTWTVRLDGRQPGPAPDSLFYVSMPPGWHVTTNAYAGIFYDPAWSASGSFRIRATVFVFPRSRVAGYGVFFAGRDLSADAPRYISVLLRRDGQYLVEHRAGRDTHAIAPWTTHPAVAQPTAESNVKNVIVIEATSDRIRVVVNDQRIAEWARDAVDSRGNGQVGIRLGQGIDVHVAELAIEPLP